MAPGWEGLPKVSSSPRKLHWLLERCSGMRYLRAKSGYTQETLAIDAGPQGASESPRFGPNQTSSMRLQECYSLLLAALRTIVYRQGQPRECHTCTDGTASHMSLCRLYAVQLQRCLTFLSGEYRPAEVPVFLVSAMKPHVFSPEHHTS